MATITYRRFIITAGVEDMTLAKNTIDRCTYPFRLLAERVAIGFVPKSEMPNVPGTDSPALAFAFTKERRFIIRRDLSKRAKRSVLLHEIGHFVDADTLTRAKRLELMALMRPTATSWREGAYREYPSEVFAETFVRAFSDVPSYLETYYLRRIGDGKLDEVQEIVLREPVIEPPPEPEPEPEPVPEPEPPTVPESPDADVPTPRVAINVVAGQVGSIKAGTEFYHPASGIRVTTLVADADAVQLVGETEDGLYRFAVIQTSKLIVGVTTRALLLVAAPNVTNVRVP